MAAISLAARERLKISSSSMSPKKAFSTSLSPRAPMAAPVVNVKVVLYVTGASATPSM
jgi:hypothetical protein